MMRLIKTVVNALGLKTLVMRILTWYARVHPRHTVRRRGVRYELDLQEVVDFATYFGGWEPETISFIEANVRPGDLVIEVGANVGVQTLQIANRARPSGHVFAFEPTEFALAKLTRNLSLNPQLADNVTVIPSLVTDHSLNVPKTSIKSSYRMGFASDLGTEHVSEAQAISLDGFVETQGITSLALLKIDVDGYEFKVLRGGRRTVAAFRPTIYIELDEVMLNLQGDSVTHIYDFLYELGYQGHFAGDAKFIADPLSLVAAVRGAGHINTVFRPQ